VQCIATGNEDLTRWRKYAGNPVIGETPADLGQTRDFRDPFVWRREGAWYMTISAHIAGVGGAVLLYRSDNLTDWEYLHPLFVGDRARSGRNFECANFFPLGDKWVMIISVMLVNAPAYTLYWVGRWEDERFIVESEGVYDAGVSYASLMHLDESGRPLIYSWLRESRSVELQKEAGWTGVQAIPRVLSLDSRNRLISRPVPEVETLRGRGQHFAAGELSETAISVDGLALDIEAEFDARAASSCGLEFSAGEDKLAVVYERSAQTLQIHRRYRQANAEIDSAPEGIVHALDAGETLQLRLLLDGSVLEVIANSRTRITSRFYPTSADNPSLRAIAPAAVIGLDVWEMALRA
jgi:beta-fructofuranosidase